MVVFSEDSSWTRFPGLKKGEKSLALVTHDESIFSANNKNRKVQEEKGKSLLRPKRKRKRIMVSKFLIPIERFHIPNSMPNNQLLQDKN